MSLLRRQIDVARGHREAVALAHGAGSDHLDAKVEIPRHPGDDPQLLKILLAEHREVRTDLREQLADHRRDAAEKMRPETILQACRGGSFRHDAGREAFGVHDLDVRIPDEVDIFRGELGDIGLPGARIGAEILRGRKLGGIDEDRDHHFFGSPLRQSHQRHMAVMERSHGRDQRDRGIARTNAIESAMKCGDRAGDHGAARHRDSDL